MMNELTQYEEKKIILMKSGLIHWVTGETGDRMSEHLANQTGHSFIRIKELGNITINTAEVEAVYNHQQYIDLCRVKSGEWQCSYGKWHAKRGECQCRQDYQKELERKNREKEERENNRDMTEEERAIQRENWTTINEVAALEATPGSIFRSMYTIGNKNNRRIRRKTIEEWEKKNGRKADTTGLAVES